MKATEVTRFFLIYDLLSSSSFFAISKIVQSSLPKNSCGENVLANLGDIGKFYAHRQRSCVCLHLYGKFIVSNIVKY